MGAEFMVEFSVGCVVLSVFFFYCKKKEKKKKIRLFDYCLKDVRIIGQI